MFDISWKVVFETDQKKYSLQIVESIEIESSVSNLVDTAIISLPDAVSNKILQLENKIKRGSNVSVYLGYDQNLVHEFEGYIKEITTNNSSIKIDCEDALFLFRKDIANQELKPTSVKAIAQRIINQIDTSFRLECDYDLPYEKFVINRATGFDVLKKLQEETSANIYFDTANKTLHIHAPYIEKGGDVSYSYQKNIENSSLEYRRAEDKKVEVTIELVNKDGKVSSVTVGTSGGEKVTKKLSSVTESTAKLIAESEYKKHVFDGYQGDIDTWLIPFVKPTYTAKIKDNDYPEKTGAYYVKSVKTSVSSSGGKRTVGIGVKLSA